MTVSIASDFSAYPAGRDMDDGDFNGQRFREEYLVPGLRRAGETGGSFSVDLDGVRSCGSSFLEEAFGGLVRVEGFDPTFLRRHLRLRFTQPHLRRIEASVWDHIGKARK